MHVSRRRKKRVVPGTRSVEVVRGRNGFGFTISGQQPCILSCIVTGSPADLAGLRPGDYLIGVDGRNVSRVPHDDVVRLIGACFGTLRLHIADSYDFSDTSDEEPAVAVRPKYPHRMARKLPPATVQMMRRHDEHRHKKVCHSPEALYHAVVGYLGTVEVPAGSSKSHVLRSCIRRLRLEKPHSIAVLSVLPDKVTLIGDSTRAEFPAERIAFCGAYAEDRKCFGLVTQNSANYSSCHVFIVDQPATRRYESPATADPVLSALSRLFRRHRGRTDYLLSAATAPVHRASSNSSNSDSGIGFRDEYADWILLMDGDCERKTDLGIDERLTVRAMPDPNIDTTMLSDEISAAKLRSSMHKYLRERQERLVKASKKISNIENGGHGGSAAVRRRRRKEVVRSLEDLRDELEEPMRAMDQCCGSYPGRRGRDPSRTLDDMVESKSGMVEKWRRSSLRRLSNRRRNQGKFEEDAASDTEVQGGEDNPGVDEEDEEEEGGKEEGRSSRAGSVASDRSVSSSRVGSWALALEKLLGDQAGFQTFSEFLKKEFSQENILFWAACERYRSLSDLTARKEAAREIYETHLCSGAHEPVNIDAYARQVTQEQLDNPVEDLFDQAQKQIFNLMKFDSYPRFLKSDLYKNCLMKDLAGQPLPIGEDPAVHAAEGDPGSTHAKLKKSKSDAEERRKSLLPWHRKNRSKSKDRGEAEYRRSSKSKKKDKDKDDSSSVRSDLSSSRTSLASCDLAAMQQKALSRESLSSSQFSDSESCPLSRIILPNKSTTVVQTKSGETIQELLTRLLERRGLKYGAIEAYIVGQPRPLDLQSDSTAIARKEVRVERRVLFKVELPNRKTVGIKASSDKIFGEVLRPVLVKYGYRWDGVKVERVGGGEVVDREGDVGQVDGERLRVIVGEGGPTLDEITNRVFEDLLRGKADRVGKADRIKECWDVDSGSKTDDRSSGHSSGLLGGILRRSSTHFERPSLEPKPKKHPKPRPAEGGNLCDLHEVLKRAQESRLEDQRGTEINFELPEFLQDSDKPVIHTTRTFVSDGVLPSPQRATRYFSCPWGDTSSSSSSSTSSLPKYKSSPNTTLVGTDPNATLTPGTAVSTAFLALSPTPPPPPPPRPHPPPPLPPKPKGLPPPLPPPSANDVLKNCRTRKAIYMGHPVGDVGYTMSFV